MDTCSILDRQGQTNYVYQQCMLIAHHINFLLNHF